MAAASDECNPGSVCMSDTTLCSVESAFPCKLHVVLGESERQGFEDVISWQGDRTFAVHDPKKFEDSIMKEYFNQTHYKSFQWQLSAHGFEKVDSRESTKESYTHNLFVRSDPNMCRLMVRTEPKKKHIRRRSAPQIVFRSRRGGMDHQLQKRRPKIARRSTSNVTIPNSLVPVFDRKIHDLETETSYRWEEESRYRGYSKIRKCDSRTSPSSSLKRNSEINDCGMAPISPVTYANMFQTDEESISLDLLTSSFGASELAGSSLSLNYDHKESRDEHQVLSGEPPDQALLRKTLDASISVMQLATAEDQH